MFFWQKPVWTLWTLRNIFEHSWILPLRKMYFFVEITSWKCVSWKYICILKIHKIHHPSSFSLSTPDRDGDKDDATLSTSVTQYCTSNSLKKNQHQMPKSLPFHLNPNIICLTHVNLDKNPFWNLTSFLPQTKSILPQREKKMFFSIPI